MPKQPNVIVLRVGADSEELVMQSKASIIIAITSDSAPVIVTGKGFEYRLPSPEGNTSIKVDSLESVSIRPAGGVTLAEDEFLKRVGVGDAESPDSDGSGSFFRRLIGRR